MTEKIVLPWPPKVLSPNIEQSRNAKGWLIPNQVSGLDDYAEVRRLYIYEAETGKFFRRITTGQRAKVGSVAGWCNRGRNWIRFRGKKFPATRVAWLYETGLWPVGEIDHINGNKSDDRMENLRDVDRSTNLENLRKSRCDNKIGIIGVRQRRGKFDARIWVKGAPIFLGSFLTAEEASSTYINAKRKLHAGCTI